MNDADAKKEARQISEEFFEEFEKALEPKRCSKQGYLDALEDLLSDVQMRIECVREELGNEGDE